MAYRESDIQGKGAHAKTDARARVGGTADGKDRRPVPRNASRPASPAMPDGLRQAQRAASQQAIRANRQAQRAGFEQESRFAHTVDCDEPAVQLAKRVAPWPASKTTAGKPRPAQPAEPDDRELALPAEPDEHDSAQPAEPDDRELALSAEPDDHDSAQPAEPEDEEAQPDGLEKRATDHAESGPDEPAEQEAVVEELSAHGQPDPETDADGDVDAAASGQLEETTEEPAEQTALDSGISEQHDVPDASELPDPVATSSDGAAEHVAASSDDPWRPAQPIASGQVRLARPGAIRPISVEQPEERLSKTIVTDPMAWLKARTHRLVIAVIALIAVLALFVALPTLIANSQAEDEGQLDDRSPAAATSIDSGSASASSGAQTPA